MSMVAGRRSTPIRVNPDAYSTFVQTCSWRTQRRIVVASPSEVFAGMSAGMTSGCAGAPPRRAYWQQQQRGAGLNDPVQRFPLFGALSPRLNASLQRMSPSPRKRCFGPAIVLLAMLVLLVGCSTSSPPPSLTSPTAPSPRPTDLTQAMGRYAVSSCALLSDQERAAYGIALPGREIDLSEGPAESCYWLTSTGIQMGWIPYPRDAARKSKADEPDARRIKVAGYAAVQTADEESCYQNVTIGSDKDFIVVGSTTSFSTVISQTQPDAPEDLCGIATSFSKLIVSKLQQFDLSP